MGKHGVAESNIVYAISPLNKTYKLIYNCLLQIIDKIFTKL